ncbi:MAG TPA: hypothetical protein VIY48_00100 [Candidatus Paceibacterota bacterium]
MNVKIGDILVSKDCQTTIGEGEVVAIGNRAVIVRVTQTTDFSMLLKVGNLYEVQEEWFSETGFYQKKSDPTFKVGEVYKYKNEGWNDDRITYTVAHVIHLDNPQTEGQNDVAIAIGRYPNGDEFVEAFEQFERKSMVKQ